MTCRGPTRPSASRSPGSRVCACTSASASSACREVFDPWARPWVRPEAADPDTVAEIVMRCPSGALHFRRLDDGPQESDLDRGAGGADRAGRRADAGARSREAGRPGWGDDPRGHADGAVPVRVEPDETARATGHTGSSGSPTRRADQSGRGGSSPFVPRIAVAASSTVEEIAEPSALNAFLRSRRASSSRTVSSIASRAWPSWLPISRTTSSTLCWVSLGGALAPGSVVAGEMPPDRREPVADLVPRILRRHDPEPTSVWGEVTGKVAHRGAAGRGPAARRCGCRSRPAPSSITGRCSTSSSSIARGRGHDASPGLHRRRRRARHGRTSGRRLPSPTAEQVAAADHPDAAAVAVDERVGAVARRLSARACLPRRWQPGVDVDHVASTSRRRPASSAARRPRNRWCDPQAAAGELLGHEASRAQARRRSGRPARSPASAAGSTL